MSEVKYYPTTSYHSVPSEGNEMSETSYNAPPKIELGTHPQIAEKRGWIKTIMWQIFALLWLVPVIALLYLNFTEYIIGASAWCPDGKCYLNAFNPVRSVPQIRARKFDKEDHNLLGGLQFVAKGLEIWFGIIAAAVIYLITMRFAGKKEGLPIGYLSRPMEFADVLSLIDPLFWVTGPHPYGTKSESEKKLGKRVWMLIALSAFLCIIINLMGPATAVLVIPALQWIETAKYGDRIFQNLNAANPPQASWDAWLWKNTLYCEPHHFRDHDYSCTQWPFGYALDAWLDSYFASAGYSGFTTQSGLTFTLNETSQSTTKNAFEALTKENDADYGKGKHVFTDYVWWAPSRQIIGNLSTDREVIYYVSNGFVEDVIYDGLYQDGYLPDPIDTYAEYNKSLELNIQRNGPIVGTTLNMWGDFGHQYHWTIDVDANRQIRCYKGYNLWYTPIQHGTSHGVYLKCIRIGSGWSDTNKKATFSAAGAYDPVTGKQGPDVNVNIFASDRAVFFPDGKMPDSVPPACFNDGPVLNKTICNWDKIFTTDPSDEMANRTQNLNTIEFHIDNGTLAATFTVDFVAFFAFTTYSLDTSPITNPLATVQNQALPNNGTSRPIDPNWILAGWSVADGGVLHANRTLTNLVHHNMKAQLENAAEGFLVYDFKQDYMSLIPVMQTLSMIDHSTVLANQTSQKPDQDHPMLQRNARMYVWAYGLGSRTSYLGAAVAILGCLVVVWQFALGLTDRRRYRSPTQLIVAALEHSPRGEFSGKGHDEKEMARVRFHVRDDDALTGKYSFYAPDH